MVKAWKKPKTIIINEWCWNTNAKYADIILPCTTTFEREDISISNKEKTVSTTHKLNGNREEIIQRSVNKALWELIKFVKNLY